MRSEVSVFLTVGALLIAFPVASLAAEVRPITGQEEDRWVPSLAITGGALIQEQHGLANSVLFEDGSTTPVPLQGIVTGSDLVISPFVGAGLELMTPALPVPTRPRLFLGAEILPTFASDREVATQEDPGCIRGPEVGAPCAMDLTELTSTTFSEESAQGEGSNTVTLTDTLTYGASLGVAFPAKLGRRQLRIKPSFGWLHYKVDGSGVVANAKCALDLSTPQFPNDTACLSRTTPVGVIPGFLREIQLDGSASQRFNAIGGGLDLEMDTVRYGPVGASLFLGARAYRTLGDRTHWIQRLRDLRWTSSEMDRAEAEWEIEVDPWMYRAHVGIRFQWLGFPE